MIKAFISHSSAQKEFVRDLVDSLGRDYCIVDCYNFTPAYKTMDEIFRKIEQSTVFVLLISTESLQSDWVKEEFKYARQRLSPDKLDRFWPYIVDETLSIEDCPEWMRKDECFNLKKFRSHKMLARDIEQKFRGIIWTRDPKRKMLDTLMVGRNSDIEHFEDIYQSARGLNLKALIVAGRDGVGKDMFILKCMDKIGYKAETVPYKISLGSKEGIENFIIQLNLITKTYNESQLIDILKGLPNDKIDKAASLLNELLDSQSVLSITDDMACVLPNRILADWLVALVEEGKMNNQLGLFIKSRKILNSFAEAEHPSFGHINLQPLDSKDRYKLFYNLMRIYNLSNVSEDDVKWFVNKLLLSPSQLVKAAEALSRNNVALVKKDIQTLVAWGDSQIKPMLSSFFGDEESRHLLIILSKMDFVSYDIMEQFFGERIVEVMEKLYEMMSFGIVSNFGDNEQFFRLDHYLSDYINRCRINLPKDLETLLNEVLEEKIRSSSDITEDVSVYLYERKQQIISGKGKPEDFLVPSVVVTSVIEIYNQQHYEQVISLCDMVLNDVHNYFQDQERELRYWLCLALARLKNERFYNEVKYFKDIDYYFLRGFYHRNAMEYHDAERWLSKALDKSPNLQRAKRELVTALLAQNKFKPALKLAKENYDKNPENSYQIHGYFRCLVRKSPLHREDIKVMEELLRAMEENLSDKHEELYAAMNIEYLDFVCHTKPTEMIDIINDAKSRFPNSINVKRASQPFLLRQSIISKSEDYPEGI